MEKHYPVNAWVRDAPAPLMRQLGIAGLPLYTSPNFGISLSDMLTVYRWVYCAPGARKPRVRRAAMGKLSRFLFGVFAYVFFFAIFLYFIGFVSNEIVPRSIAVGPASDLLVALTVDVLLVSLFAIQHSIMARPWFKTALGKYWPNAIERSLYVAMSALALYLLFRFWLPIPAVLWQVENPLLRNAIWGVAGLGWGTVLLSTFLIDHFELFGLRQIWSDWKDRAMPSQTFRQPFFYKLVRHPIYTGFLMAFWATPDMSVGHLVFSLAMTLYIFIGIRYEEKDLLDNLGDAYEQYTREVGKVIPGLGKAR